MAGKGWCYNALGGRRVVAAPILEADAPPSTRAVFDEARASMRAPFTPALFRTLGRWPAYLELVWPQLRPSVETAGFRGSAQYLAAMAREAVDQFYEPVFGPESLRQAGLTDADLAGIAATLEVLHLTNPQALLLAGALTEAIERPRVGGQGRPEPRDLSDEEARIAAYEWRMAEEAELPPAVRALADDVKTILGLPFLTDDFRALARWPAFLEQAWAELRELRVYKLFRQRGRGLYFYARSSSRFLAQPLEANAERLRAAGLTDGDIDGVADALRMFCGVLPNHMMNTAAMQHALGIRPALPPPPGRKPG